MRRLLCLAAADDGAHAWSGDVMWRAHELALADPYESFVRIIMDIVLLQVHSC